MQRFLGITLIASLSACGRYSFKDVPDAQLDAPPDAGMCGAKDDLHPMGQLSSYRIGSPIDSWDHAEASCEADGYGAHLVVFDNSLEMNAAEDIAAAGFGNTKFWIGISDRVTDMSFIPVTGGVTPFFPSWVDNAPSIVGPSCVLFDPDTRRIQDLPCAMVANYICECDGTPPKANAY